MARAPADGMCSDRSVLRDVSESEEGWTAPVVGFSVVEVRFGGQAYVTAYGQRADDEQEAPNTTISLPSDFDFVDQTGAEHALNGEASWESLTPLLSLRHDRIASAVADRRGWLVVLFDSGAKLEVRPNGQFENWQLMGPNGVLIVGLPTGGEPAVWGAVTDT